MADLIKELVSGIVDSALRRAIISAASASAT
jgi:hypothetical protein